MNELSFNDAEIALLMEGLGKLPAERSYNLLTKMAQAVYAEEQRRKAAMAAKEAAAIADANAGPEPGY